MALSIDVAEKDGWTIVAPTGEIDIRSAPELRERVNGVLESGATKIVVDLERVDFLDSTALSVMVGAHKRLQRAGSGLDLVCTNEQLLRVLNLTGLNRIFRVHDSLDAAFTAQA